MKIIILRMDDSFVDLSLKEIVHIVLFLVFFSHTSQIHLENEIFCLYFNFVPLPSHFFHTMHVYYSRGTTKPNLTLVGSSRFIGWDRNEIKRTTLQHAQPTRLPFKRMFENVLC